MRKYVLKRDAQDERDLQFMHSINPHASVKLPSKVDLRSNCPPIFDQGQLGSCTANAGVACRQMLSGKPFTNLSRLFLYYEERVIEGSVKQDAGASMRDICKALATYGVCQEILMPYDIAKFAIAPSVKAVQDALTYKIRAYKNLGTLTEIQQALAITQKPVLIGMAVYESFESDVVAKTGKMPMPKTREQNLGGHAVLVVGYDNVKKVLIVRNSWGATWGDAGYFYMPYAYITKELAYDFWTIE